MCVSGRLMHQMLDIGPCFFLHLVCFMCVCVYVCACMPVCACVCACVDTLVHAAAPVLQQELISLSLSPSPSPSPSPFPSSFSPARTPRKSRGLPPLAWFPRSAQCLGGPSYSTGTPATPNVYTQLASHPLNKQAHSTESAKSTGFIGFQEQVIQLKLRDRRQKAVIYRLQYRCCTCCACVHKHIHTHTHIYTRV